MKTIALIAAVSVLSAAGTYVPEENAVTVQVDGITVNDGGLSYVDDGVTWVPFRETSEALGATVVIWEPAAARAAAEAPGLKMTLTENTPYLEANGRYFYIPGGCRLENGHFMLPVRTLCRAFGVEVSWYGGQHRVEIKKAGMPVLSGDKYYNEQDIYWMSRIIRSEAGSESFVGKIAVGNVVMNRLESASYPNTVKGVIFDRRSGIQFSPAYSGAIYCTPDRDCIIAAKLALDGAQVVEDGLFFAQDTVAWKCWAGKNRPYLTQIGGHVFFA